MSRPRLLALSFLPLAFPMLAQAEETPTAPIIVTGGGLEPTPAAPVYGIEVLDRADLSRAASGRIEDALGQIAGLQQFRRSDSRSANPSAQGVTLRALGGNASSRTLVLLDGVPMADPFFGYIPFGAIDPVQLAMVRVTRGGGAGAFGSGAVAGTIEFESAGPDQLGRGGEQMLVNDRGDTEASQWFAPRLGKGFAVLSGRWDRGNGFWTTPLAQRGPASVRAGFDSWSIGLRAVAPLSPDLELQVRGLAFDDRRTLRFAGADSRSAGQDASIRLVGRGAWQFELLGYVQARDFSNVVISATSFRKTLDQRKTPSTGLGGKLELRPPVEGGHVLRLGADLRIAEGTLQEEPFSAVTGLATARRRAGGRNSDLGLYVENDWTGGPLTLTAGLRADRWTIRGGFFRETDPVGLVQIERLFPGRAGWSTSVRGGVVLRLGRGLSLRAAGYSGLRQPTLNELYRPFVVFPVTTRANAALANEELRGLEGGVDLAAGGFSLSLTGFDNRIRNAIANVTIAPNLRERRNVDAVHARGIELSAAWRSGTLELRGSLAYSDAAIEASGISALLNGKRPAQTARLSAVAGLVWEPRERWSLAFNLRHTGAQFEDDLNSDLLPQQRPAACGDHAGCRRRHSARWDDTGAAGREHCRPAGNHPQAGQLDRPRSAAHFLGWPADRILGLITQILAESNRLSCPFWLGPGR